MYRKNLMKVCLAGVVMTTVATANIAPVFAVDDVQKTVQEAVVEEEKVPQLDTNLIQTGKYDMSGNWVSMSGNDLLTNDQVIFNVKTMLPEGYTYNSANILVNNQWIPADENGYVVVDKTSQVTQVGMWLEKDGQTLADPAMAMVNYNVTVDQTAPVISELNMYTVDTNGQFADFEGGVTDKDVMIDVVANDDVEVDYVFYTSETGSTPVFEKIPGTDNAYRYVFAEEGIYNGVISVKDKAGNYTEQPVSFTVDKEAPVISELNMYTMDANGQFADFEGGVTNEDVMIDVVANDNVEVDYVFYTSETGSTPVFEKIPGTDNAYRYVFAEEGTYNGVISVKDKAGNYTEQPVSFTIDKTAPTIDELHMYTMNDNGTYEDFTGGHTSKNVMVDVVASDNVEVDYVFYTSETGSTPVFEKIPGTDNAYRYIFSERGKYNGVISLKDAAGNYTEKEVSFLIA